MKDQVKMYMEHEAHLKAKRIARDRGLSLGDLYSSLIENETSEKREAETPEQAIRKASKEFHASKHRYPSIEELTDLTDLTRHQVWGICRDRDIPFISRKELREKKLLDETIPALRDFLKADPEKRIYYPWLTRTSEHLPSKMRIADFEVTLSQHYEDMKEAMPEFYRKVKSAVADYDREYGTN